ncbi:hypothetical protein, partial [Actinomadura sp. NPDC048394]|uniref:hypothetical protein n=1 Tax=Actinomadura sp. NPDC048394 TaxID=3158223 RepID=UPI0033DDFCEB
PPRSSKVYISFDTTSVDSPTPRRNRTRKIEVKPPKPPIIFDYVNVDRPFAGQQAPNPPFRVYDR